LLVELAERIEATTPPDRHDALLVFSRMMLRRLGEEDLTSRGVQQLLGIVRSAFAFVDGRGNHPAAVRVFVPTIDHDGYVVPGTVIETNTDDSPFLVDSVTEELAARNLGVRLIVHPMIGTVRAEDGHLERVMAGRDAAHRESLMHFELDRRLNEQDRGDLERRIRAILHDVRLVVRDFEPMQERVHHMGEIARQATAVYSPPEIGETVDFVEWLLQLNFVLLGYREYRMADGPEGRTIQAVPGSGLGILADVSSSAFSDATPLNSLDPDIRRRIEEGELLVITKTKAYSTVHRRARMDYVGVRIVSPEGQVVGEARLIGLFTSKAYMERART
jgi:glutamate dehydrogenase